MLVMKGANSTCTSPRRQPSLITASAPAMPNATKLTAAIAKSIMKAIARAVKEASGAPSNSAMRALSCPM